jgi:hypothetical protein
MGPFDLDLAATGEAADAVGYACRVPGHAARAVGLFAAGRGESEATATLAESAQQCSLLREMVGNPFACGVSGTSHGR